MLQIKKRDGDLVAFNPKKIYDRIKKSAKGLKVNSDEIFIKVITSIPTEGIISTKELDKLVSEISASYTGSHYDYSKLAATVSISSYHKETVESFSETMFRLHDEGIINSKLIDIIKSYGLDAVDRIIKHDRDYNFDYFAWRTLQEMYLTKTSKGFVIERPQHMYLRVSLWITNSIEEAIEYYESLSNQLISPATPIMINSGTKKPQLASCVLHYNDGDSREGLLKTFSDISSYSADAAGIGLCMSNIRSKDTKIATSGGNAGGLLKYLKIVNEGLRFFNQQGKRPGSAAIYIEPWHRDIFDLLDIKKNTGAEELRARDIFTALWIPDNFMKAVENSSDWYLFCPNDIIKSGLKPLDTIYGEEYENEYNKAIELGIGKKVKAQDVLLKIIESQIETGVPYIGFKDSANKKTNHQNIGTIRQSNLCIEIMQSTNEETTAICTLSSIILKNYLKGKKFDFILLHSEVRKVVNALNKVIDINSYSTEKGRKGGLEQRAIAIGIQGFADLIYLMDLIFTGKEARILNKQIAETIYHAAITESNNLCISKKYKPYSFFEGSPMQKGIFQFDMWGLKEEDLSGLWDWKSLKESVTLNGICNSLFLAYMPTASSAKITGSYESFEPMDSNLFNRRVVGGEFLIVNKYLITDLEDLGLWSENMKNEIIIGNGSVQNINFQKYLDVESKGYEKKVKRIEHLISKYKTVWEISQKELIEMSAERAPFIDQSQSLNIYMGNPTVGKLSSSMMFAWKQGLKTGSYYLRSKPVSTGAKHLAIDMSNVLPQKLGNNPISEEAELQLLIEKESLKVQKPEDSQFDCFGCSS
ncbi:MAG: ribonucleoside-diphosphate reductase subunit alpha [Bacteroidia bacterium]